MSEYETWIKSHLAAYKTNILGIAEHGVSSEDKQKHPHILPHALHRHNILEGYRDEFWEYFEGRVLHREFHHLTHSQAMAYNLFFPLVGDWPLLRRVLGFGEEAIVETAFEKTTDAEEGTVFDFYTRFESGTQVFCDVSLAESNFGTARQTERLLKKLTDIYQPRLQGKVSDDLIEAASFFRYYHFLRDVSYLSAESADTLLVIFPFKNTELLDQTEFLMPKIDERIRAKIKLIDLAEIVIKVFEEIDPNDTVMLTHYQQFQEKYIGEDE